MNHIKVKGNVAIIGSGRSGRGLLGELCFLEGYRIAFADVDRALVSKMRERGKYTSFRQNDAGDGFQETVISGYDVYHTIDDRQEYLQALTNADIIFTATFDDAFDAIATDFHEALKIRMQKGIHRQFAFILGANYIGLYDYFASSFDKLLSKDEKAFFNQYAVMVESIIYRVSSFPSPEQKAKDELGVQSDNFNVLQVNTGQIAGATEIKIPDFFVHEDDTLRFMHCKIWDINTSHCSLAYLGQFYGKECICDAANDDHISRCAFYASQEAYRGLSKRYHLPPKTDKEIAEVWEYYRDRTIKDTVIRVGNDPIRKLRRNDRFIGAALNALNYGILPVYICQNAAYGFFFHNEGDARTDKLKEILNENGIAGAIEKVCQLDLTKPDEKIIFDLILAKYNELKQENPIDKY
jgi:hypothetical protein